MLNINISRDDYWDLVFSVENYVVMEYFKGDYDRFHEVGMDTIIDDVVENVLAAIGVESNRRRG